VKEQKFGRLRLDKKYRNINAEMGIRRRVGCKNKNQ
jgi:hypothetical protein